MKKGFAKSMACAVAIGSMTTASNLTAQEAATPVVKTAAADATNQSVSNLGNSLTYGCKSRDVERVEILIGARSSTEERCASHCRTSSLFRRIV